MGFGLSYGLVIGRVLEVRPGQYGDTMLVLDDSNEKYPTEVACEFQSDKAKATLKGLGPNDLVRVEGSPRSREWNGKLFTNFVAWRAQRMDMPRAGGGAQHREAKGGVDDDIPF